MANNPRPDNVLTHWKCLAACTLVSMCPFQYGTDFGIIGGLQAMPGFLEVRLLMQADNNGQATPTAEVCSNNHRSSARKTRPLRSGTTSRTPGSSSSPR
jgi:hypothetical protein